MSAEPVEIYGTANCPWCVKAKQLCEQNGYAFQYYDLTADPSLRGEFVTRTNGAKTVPQIFVGIRRIGGHDDLVAAHRSGLLQQLLGGR